MGVNWRNGYRGSRPEGSAEKASSEGSCRAVISGVSRARLIEEEVDGHQLGASEDTSKYDHVVP